MFWFGVFLYCFLVKMVPNIQAMVGDFQEI